MKKSTKAAEVKERIIEVTIALIQNSNGNAAEITTRDIANQNTAERMTNAATAVFEFLFANPAISRISILGDLSDPNRDSNTVKSQQNICHVLRDSMNDADKKIFSFVLAASMQAAFLASQCGDTMIGYTLDTKASRKAFIEKLVDMMRHGIKAEDR